MTVTLLERDWVHKRYAENVFIGGPERMADDEFATPALFPVDHPFYNDCVSGLSASGYLIEVARQVNLAISHRFFEVPLSAGFLVTAIDWSFNDDAPFVVADLADFSVLTHVERVVRRKGVVCKLETRTRFVQGEHEFLAGGAAFLISTRNLTEGGMESAELCRPARPGVAPGYAQVHGPASVLLEAPDATRSPGGRLAMRVDTEHPYFFEHPNSHVPGMMLLEAAKQAAVYAAFEAFPVLSGMYGDLHSGEIRFGRFAEPGQTIWMGSTLAALEETRFGYSAAVEVCFEQGEREIGRVGGSLSFIDRREVDRSSAILRGRALPASARAASAGARGQL
jgi:hypothetical protein